MLQANLIVHPADCPCGIPKVAELPRAVKIDRIENDVIMDMVLVYMSTDDKGVIPFRQLHGKLLTDLICFFRGELSGQKGLTQMISNHIVTSAAPACEVDVLLLCQHKFCVGSHSVTHIAVYEFAIICLLRILHIVDDVCYGGRSCSAFARVKRYKPCGSDTIIPLH